MSNERYTDRLPIIFKVTNGNFILDDQTGVTSEIPFKIDGVLNPRVKDQIDLLDYLRKPKMNADTILESLEKGTWVVT
jgi:hypothetical protein